MNVVCSFVYIDCVNNTVTQFCKNNNNQHNQQPKHVDNFMWTLYDTMWRFPRKYCCVQEIASTSRFVAGWQYDYGVQSTYCLSGSIDNNRNVIPMRKWLHRVLFWFMDVAVI